ncbi:putative Zinc finger-XS domain-containing protein [Helianthus annuus]|nr:putative Zinc finger-XS domain-containing protein [Helianthus annuus]
MDSQHVTKQHVEDHDETEEVEESDDELQSDEYDSDEMPKSHEEQKKYRWYLEFFKTLDLLIVDQVNEPTRQWHCPAGLNRPGAIDWYKSLQSLLTHAKTKGRNESRFTEVWLQFCKKS